MEANDFIARLKANGTDKDLCDILAVGDQYKVIIASLAVKDRGPFSLNILCTLCRNLDKVPSWRDSIDVKALLLLSIDCVRETRTLSRPDRVKTLACIYHIHKHVVKVTTPVAPELVLKLSYMPFDDTNQLLEEYCKTYWNIIADRLTYIERIKAKHSIAKLLKRLSDDSIKVIQIYDSAQFCCNILPFLVKKLHYLYNTECAKELKMVFREIFKSLSTKKDLSCFKNSTEKELLDGYAKLCDCLYVIAENESRSQFKEPILNTVTRTCITMLGHNQDIMRCLETFFLNGFCCIFEDLTNINNIENVLTNMMASCVSIEKSGHEKVMYATYPFINQLLRLFIEYSVTNTSNVYFKERVQYVCLNFMLLLSGKKTEQQVKCENCKVKSGLHDSLRLLFLIKHLPTMCIAQNIDMNKILPTYHKLVLMQHKIVFDLKRLGCSNHDKCFRKLQTDIHNTAISLNKSNYYDYSIKLFNIYIEVELRFFKDNSNLKNVSRALYNKSICELDSKQYADAVSDALLSLVFSLPEGLESEKHMSLVIDIKAKALKADDSGEVQLISVTDACKTSVEQKKYGNLKPFFTDLKLSECLRHEFAMYCKLWPSIVPIAGVWRSLYGLLKNSLPWTHGESEDTLAWTLYGIVLETPSVVRTIHSDHYSAVVADLLSGFEAEHSESTEANLVHAGILFLQCEYDLAQASVAHEWKATEQTLDPDQTKAIRTIPQEHQATRRAMEAVNILKTAVKYIHAVPPSKWFRDALQLYQVFVLQLLHLHKTLQALQLARVCCVVAEHLGDSESFVTNASLLIRHAEKKRPEIDGLVTRCGSVWRDVSRQTAMCFTCDAAMYYSKCGSVGVASRLVRSAQAKILEAYTSEPDVNLDLAVGRLMEAHHQICGSANALTTISGIQRHYLSISNTETRWYPRRRLALTLKHLVSRSSLRAVGLCRALMLWRRARVAAAVALPASAAVSQAMLFAGATNVHVSHDVQTKVDNRLKHILGLQPSNEPQRHDEAPAKPKPYTPRPEALETMLESMVFCKTQTSPSIPCTTVYGHKIPEFFHHHHQCTCCLCDNPHSYIIACTASGLESSMYYRAKEFDIARNYFEGSLKCFDLAERRLKSYFKGCKGDFDLWLVELAEYEVANGYGRALIEVLVEACFFELTQGSLEKADDLIVRIHEVMQDIPADGYVKNEVLNLVTVSAHLRRMEKKTKSALTNLEYEMESLKLTPKEAVENPKTPELKAKAPPKMEKNVVKNEELPLKRKVIKLNLDDTDDKEVVKPVKAQFKVPVPVPVTSRAVPETITPRTRGKPRVLVSKPSIEVEMTPKSDRSEFFTPTSTPAEEFFTPMTSVKTYAKRSLRQNIVKNLEEEFSTPKADKENSTLNADSKPVKSTRIGTRSIKPKIDRSMLKRATSPGKLVSEKPKATRSRMKPFVIHEDDKK